MGRRSIPIKEIKEERRRHVTFSKRKVGLFKKAMELSILCKAQFLLVVFDENSDLYECCSSKDPRPILRKYFTTSNGSHERVCNEDYESLYAKAQVVEKDGTTVKKNPARKTPIPHSSTPPFNFNMLTAQGIPMPGFIPTQPYVKKDDAISGGEKDMSGQMKELQYAELPKQSNDQPAFTPMGGTYYTGSTGFTPLPGPGTYATQQQRFSPHGNMMHPKKRKYATGVVTQIDNHPRHKKEQLKRNLRVQVPTSGVEIQQIPVDVDESKNIQEQNMGGLHSPGVLTPMITLEGDFDDTKQTDFPEMHGNRDVVDELNPMQKRRQ